MSQNPLVVGDLFSRQCKPWQGISKTLVEYIHEAASITFNKLVSSICDTNTKHRLLAGMIQPSLSRLRQQLSDRVDELLEPHLSIHPISYNEFLIDFVQEVQAKRHKRKFDRVALEACGVSTETAVPGAYKEILLKKLLDALLEGTEPDVREYSASLAADVAAAYYKVMCLKVPDYYCDD